MFIDIFTKPEEIFCVAKDITKASKEKEFKIILQYVSVQIEFQGQTSSRNGLLKATDDDEANRNIVQKTTIETIIVMNLTLC